jgi:hypothetical protein
MKTFNCTYTDEDDLINFITQNINNKQNNQLLIQIFSGKLDSKLLSNITTTILNQLPNSKIIGATTDGEILENKVSTKNIIISFSQFEKSSIKLSVIEDIKENGSYKAGKDIAKNLLEENSKVFILFADGLHINGEELLNGVQKIVPNITISGGLAGDNATFEGTYVIHNDKIIQNAVVGISINSDNLIVNNGYSFAWQNIGKKFKVNKSKKNIVYEIDGMTPVALYEKYLGKAVSDLLPGIGIEFPLIIQNNDIDMARAVLAKNDDGSLVFAGNIEEGSTVRFGVGNTNELLNDTINLTNLMAKKETQSIFIYSCMARRRFLDSQSSEDIEHFSKIANVAGFFTYGEFFTTKNEYKFLNETLTILSLSEDVNTLDKNFNIKSTISSKVTTLQALSHLVNVSSHELDSLNEKLEEEISVEIERNLENEKKIFDSLKMSSLGDMIGNIAHQWRQPLSVISTSASGMQMQKELNLLTDEAFQRYTNSMIDQAMYLSDTINTFRDFIKEDYVLTDIILQEDIDKTLKLIDVVLKDNNIKLINNVTYDSPIKLNLIAGELSQVIINIFNNAKDALIEKEIKERVIYLSLITQEDKYIITIEDNAGGIPKEILPKIFEPYFSTKLKTTGTGIGLHMSYDIITKHFGGNLYAKNTENGAKFYIELPKPN